MLSILLSKYIQFRINTAFIINSGTYSIFHQRYNNVKMSCKNIEAVSAQIVLRQKQSIKCKENQLNFKFKWLSKYLQTPQNNYLKDHNFVTKSMKLYTKPHSKKLMFLRKPDSKEVNVCQRRDKHQQLKLVQQRSKSNYMNDFCTQTLNSKQESHYSKDRFKKKNMRTQQNELQLQMKNTKMKGRSFLLHNFNTNKFASIYQEKRCKTTTALKENKLYNGSNCLQKKKRSPKYEDDFLLCAWDMQESISNNKENIFF